MNHTLHQCHVNSHMSIDNLRSYCALMSTNDEVVFYGRCLTAAQKQRINVIFAPFTQHFIFFESPHHSNIGADEWVELVDRFDKTYSWKES